MVQREHECSVEGRRYPDRWVVECEACGTVGQPQEYEQDAVNIAKRHEEVGGFEPSID